MKTLLTIALITLFTLATYAMVPAYWTGHQRQVTTATGRLAVACEYRYNNRYFWKVFEDRCPNVVEIY